MAGIPASQLAFIRYASCFVISIAVIAHGRLTVDRFKTDHPWQVISGPLLLMSATLSNFYALQFLPRTVVSAIMFYSPVIVCFLSITLLKEYVGPWRICAILLGFVGVMIMVPPFGTAFHPAMLKIIYNATALALYSIMTRQLSGIVAFDTMQFYMVAVGTFALLPFAVWSWVQPDTLWGLIVLTRLGAMGWGGHQLLTNSHRFGTANQLMPFPYSFLIYVAIWWYLVFGTVPEFWAIASALVIMMAGLIICKREQQ